MNDNLTRLRDEFTVPPAAFRPMMFWMWNGQMTPVSIEQQITDFKEKGLGGFVLHPIARQFEARRLGGCEPDYLSDEYFELVRHAAQCARREGLHLWLYDEGGWPSGDAQGKVMEGHPEFYAQVLVPEVVPVEQVHTCPDECVCAVAVMEGYSLRLVAWEPGQPVNAPAGATHICFFIVKRILPEPPENSHVPDTLSPACVARFIEVTHARYAQFCGEFFGNVIPGIFTDETRHPGQVATGQIPYTGGIFDDFEHRKGFDIRPYLPLLFAPEAIGLDLTDQWPAQAVISLRCEYADFVVDLFKEAYWEQINDWCAAHDLIHTGHVGGEDNLPDHVRGRFSDFFRTAGALQAPGVDTIWRQIFPGQDNFCFPLFASSAAHLKRGQGGEEGSVWDNLVTSESYAVYGLGLNFWQMRWVADFQYLLGVNCLMPMLIASDTSEGKFLGTFCHTGPGNPFWEHYEGFADYIGRLSVLMRQGVGLADIAVYYPIEPFWADPQGEGAANAWASLQEITGLMLGNQTAFDFIDAASIGDAQIGDGGLEAPGQIYTTVVIPETPILPANVAEKLLEFHRAGGRVCFCGLPPSICSQWQAQERFEQAMQELLADAWFMEAVSEDAHSGATLGGLHGPMPMWDGFTSAYLGPRTLDEFLPQEIKPDAVLVADKELWFKLVRILATRAGHYGLQPLELTPDLLLTTRPVGDIAVHFALNNSDQALQAELTVVSEEPLLVERWDAESGAIEPLAIHDEVTEATGFVLELPPYGSALLVARSLPDVSPALSMRAQESPVLATWETADHAEVVEAHVIRNGSITVKRGEYEPLEGPVPLMAWHELGLADLSGTVAYVFALILADEYVNSDYRLILELAQVYYVAEVWVNGNYAGTRLWQPHRIEITDFVVAGENEIVIQVTNSLANQVVREEFLAEARENDWIMEGYFNYSYPWMQEATYSGLIGEVRIYLVEEA